MHSSQNVLDRRGYVNSHNSNSLGVFFCVRHCSRSSAYINFFSLRVWPVTISANVEWGHMKVRWHTPETAVSLDQIILE